jgi:tetratricopeptide (TPR) repeat protein
VWSCLSSPPPSARARGDGTRTAADPEDVKERLETLSPEEQVPFLQSLLSQHTENPRLSFYLGNAYLNLSKPDSAIVHYAEALKFDSTYAKAHVNMAIAFERMNRFDEAKDHYEKAIEIDSTDVLAYCHLGHYYHVRGEMGEAVARYQRALAIDPESAQAHYNLGLAFADSRLFGEALVEWKKVVALAPDSEIGRTAAENVRLIEAYVEMDKGSSEGP